ncbi:MAG: HIT domain-containing protein [Planctomycetes bacterium]|nr:HIT domain-containing protein [Planctomycetota bacterium]
MADRADSERSTPGPDAIHAPWRLAYLESLGQASVQGTDEALDSGSFLRDYWLAPEHDGPNHVIVRTGLGIIVLNKFPYSNGHLLAALGEARPSLFDYEPDQRAALWRLTELAADLMERTLQPQGINIGINQGRAAGAGIPGHLHVHIVPRWIGDVNFITTVGRIRVIPAALDAMAERYRRVWATLNTP